MNRTYFWFVISFIASVFCIGIVWHSCVPNKPLNAEMLESNRAYTLHVGTGQAYTSSERGSSARTGRVPLFPKSPVVRWSKTISPSIQFSPLVTSRNSILVVGSALNTTQAKLIEVHSLKGHIISEILVEKPIVTPILLTNETRVLVTRTHVIGFSPMGSLLFRTSFMTRESTSRMALSPLPTGGFIVLQNNIGHSSVLLEYDSAGHELDRTQIEVDAVPFVAVRHEGSSVFVSINGDVYQWRARHRLKKIGAFIEKGFGSQACPWGPLIAETKEFHNDEDYVVCVAPNRIEKMNLDTGAVHNVLASNGWGFRSALALGAAGDMLAATTDGAVHGLDAQGKYFGPINIQGVPLAPIADAGSSYVLYANEFSPYIDSQGTILFGSTTLVLYDSNGQIKPLTQCLGTPAGVAFAEPRTLIVACSNGLVEFWKDATAAFISTPK